MTAFRALLFLLLTAHLALLAGCSTRGPGSDTVLPPTDLNREQWQEGLEELRRSEELNFARQDEYYIGPGDVLSLTLVGRQELLGFSREDDAGALRIQVTDNPFIVLPHIGSVRVHGKTRLELQEDIRQAYDAIINNPMPILTIDNYFYNQVTVLGSVQAPSRYELRVGDTLLDAIFEAGGLSFGGRGGGGGGGLPPARILKVYREKVTPRQRAELSVDELVEIFRNDRQEILPREEIIIPLDEFILGGDLEWNIPLQPNDIVYIPPAGTISVQGPFEQPRVVFLGPGLRTLSSVAVEAGGLKYKAASRVEIIRQLPDGEVESIFVDLRDIMKRDDPDIYLEDNDKVVAYVHPGRAVLAFIGDIFSASANTGVSATYSPL